MRLRPFSLTVLPSGDEEAGLRKLISELAAHFNAPTFNPHLTVLTGYYLDGAEDPDRIVRELAQKVFPFCLTVNGVYGSEVVYRSAALCFEPNSSEVLDISTAARGMFSQIEFEMRMPHLSVLYHVLGLEERRQLITELINSWLGKPIRFDRFEIIYPAAEDESLPDPFVQISRWRVSENILFRGHV